MCSGELVWVYILTVYDPGGKSCFSCTIQVQGRKDSARSSSGPISASWTSQPEGMALSDVLLSLAGGRARLVLKTWPGRPSSPAGTLRVLGSRPQTCVCGGVELEVRMF